MQDEMQMIAPLEIIYYLSWGKSGALAQASHSHQCWPRPLPMRATIVIWPRKPKSNSIGRRPPAAKCKRLRLAHTQRPLEAAHSTAAFDYLALIIISGQPARRRARIIIEARVLAAGRTKERLEGAHKSARRQLAGATRFGSSLKTT